MGITVTAEQALGLRGEMREWAYNGFDCCVPHDIKNVLLPRLTPAQARIYAFERACQSPALAMMRRGIRIDTVRRSAALADAKRDLRKVAAQINKLPLVTDFWDGTDIETGFCKAEAGKRHKWPRGVPDSPERKCERCGAARVKPAPFNPNSPPQTSHLFWDIHGVPKQRNKKGEISTDEEVIQRIGRKWVRFRPLTDAIIIFRKAKKQIGFLNSKLSPDSRMMSSFNVGTAWTGRWSGSKNPFRLGTNPQNIAEKHRAMFIADAGMTMGYADLGQAESRVVAYSAGDEAYIEAHKTGDVHTAVARMLWPELPWTGDMVEDRTIADTAPDWDPDHPYRHTCKRCQHGLNYGLTPQGLSAWAHIPLKEARAVYERYYTMFPRLKARHEMLRRAVREQNTLVNLMGRPCALFGRPWDEHTAKQGFAFDPQSTVGDLLNLALWHVWKSMDPFRINLLAQIHDAILFQFLTGDDEAVREVVGHMTIPVVVPSPTGERTMVIPVDVQVGQNWGHRIRLPDGTVQNPTGLVAWEGAK